MELRVDAAAGNPFSPELASDDKLGSECRCQKYSSCGCIVVPNPTSPGMICEGGGGFFSTTDASAAGVDSSCGNGGGSAFCCGVNRILPTTATEELVAAIKRGEGGGGGYSGARHRNGSRAQSPRQRRRPQSDPLVFGRRRSPRGSPSPIFPQSKSGRKFDGARFFASDDDYDGGDDYDVHDSKLPPRS